jgi:hypothetical protein
MSANIRVAVVWLFSAILAAALGPAPLAEAHGHGGGGSGGGHSGGWSGGRAVSGSFSHVESSAFGPNHSSFSSFAGRSGSWNHGVWNHDQGWWNHHVPGRNDFFGFGIYGWPWYAFGWGSGYWGSGYWWPGYVDYGFAPYGDLYGGYYDSGALPYADDSWGVAPASVRLASAEAETGAPEAGGEASEFYSQALVAFRQGDYGNATRLAGHAAIDDPRNPDVHILAMLGLFAIGEYRGAAMEAHAVAAMGHVPDWPALYGFYEDVTPYTEHLRKLESFVRAHPSAAEGQFLLGFQYLMEGEKEAAKAKFTAALKLTPRDTLAAKLLTQAGGTVPPGTIAQPPQPSSPAARTANSPGLSR